MASAVDAKGAKEQGRHDDDAKSDTTEQTEKEVLESGTAPPSDLRSMKRSERTRSAVGDLPPRCISASLWKRSAGEVLSLIEIAELAEANKKEKVAPFHAQFLTEIFKRLAAVSHVLDKLQREDRDVSKEIRIKGSQLYPVQQEVESLAGAIAVFREYDRMCSIGDYLKTKDQLQIPSQALRPEYARRFLRTGIQPECEAQAEDARKAREDILQDMSKNYILVRKVKQAQGSSEDAVEPDSSSESGKRGKKR